MPSTTYLPAPSTTGYTERREATFNDDGTLSQLLIFVDWADGTTHHQTINFAGPPDHTFSTSGALSYPDGSRTSISVPPDGTIVLTHDWTWVSPPDSVVDNRNGTDTWAFRPDGTGTLTSVVEFDNGLSYGVNKEWHSFDRDGGITSDTHMMSVEVHVETGLHTTIETTLTLEGKRTQHTTVKDAHGVLIVDDTLITWVNPPIVPEAPVTAISRPRGKTEGADRPPPEGPQTVTPKTLVDAGGSGGICGLPRSVSGGSGGMELCEHYTDYYVVSTVKVKDEQEPGTEVTYLGSRYHGVGPC